MSAELPSVPAIQKRLRRRSAIRDSWPFFVWLGIAALAYWAFKQGGTFARLNAVVAVPTNVVKAPETGVIKELAPGLQLGTHLKAGDLIAQMDTSELEDEIQAKIEDAKWDATELKRQLWGDEQRMRSQQMVAMAEQKEADATRDAVSKELDALKKALSKGAATTADVSAKETSLAEAQARAGKATDLFNGLADLIKKVVENRETMEADADRRAGEATSARVKVLKTQMAKLTLKSPAAGQVTRVLVRPGEVVRQGDPVVELAQEGTSSILASVPEEESATIAPGQIVFVSLPNDRKHYQPAKVTKVAPILTEMRDQGSPVQGRMVRGRRVEIEAPANVAHLVPGTWVIVSLKEPTRIPFMSFFTQ